MVLVLRSIRSWFWLVLVVALGFGWWYFVPSAEERIRNQLEDLSAKLSFEGAPPQPKDIPRLHALLERHFAANVTVDIAEVGEIRQSLDDFVTTYVAYASELTWLELRLEHVRVKTTSETDRATAAGELFVTTNHPSGERRTEPRRFIVTFEKRERHWRVTHAKITESRIDQPEARP